MVLRMQRTRVKASTPNPSIQLPEGQRRDVLINAQFSDPEQDLPLIQRAKQLGFKVELHGVTIDPTVAVTRAEGRAGKDGRSIKSETMLPGHQKFNAAWPQLAVAVDKAGLWENSGEGLRKIASVENGALEILDKNVYK